MKLLLVACVLVPLAIVTVRMARVGSARSYTPFGTSRKAREQLAAQGRQGSLAAYEELRSSILATRSIVTPDRDLLVEANHAIEKARGNASLPSEPSRAWSLVALVGLAAFVSGSAQALRGRAQRAALAGVGFVLLIVGLWRA